ncbi:sacsin N-terminal ATP-binding-like domain-containing protein [Paenarthrobacter nitroguajacolicus]|uniref:sacsin N-terminal ATP-binding-like domain-containing protein n=1 Tax=Paenarthrobacter nitroguajacolicus TaxID=211146 RepID=UPI000AB40B37|nr:ATP-binding protein [Paenarthrobacter nitroguajacolicus]
MSDDFWADAESDLSRFVANETLQALNAYKARPDLIREHSNIEQAITQSGYGRKQLNELIQNASDAIDLPHGRIRIVLTDEALYCANDGAPFTEAGYRTLMLSHSSEKRDDQIGRFGLGFKSVIQISDSPQIFSRSCSVKWDRRHSTELLEPLLPGLASYPVLRIATPVSPVDAASSDPVLAELMAWAATVVKLPLVQQAAWLSEEMRKFPHEFLLFSQNIGLLEFDNRIEGTLTAWTARRNGFDVLLENGEMQEEWRIFRYKHQVSPQAAVEAGSIAARDTVDVTWAVPIKGNPRRQRGSFWNYFPTSHTTSLRGIVNAAFKMNEDRHSMLHTLYNKEILQKAVPMMVAGSLASFQDKADPAGFLDLLPARGREAPSWADSIINEPIFAALSAVPCLPDRAGELQLISNLWFPPDLEEASRLENMWDSWVGLDRPWLHRSASTTKERRLIVRRLLALANKGTSPLEQWLEEITYGNRLDDFENALRMAVEVDKHHPDHRAAMRRSRIVLMHDGTTRPPITSKVFLPIDEEDEGDNLVSYELLHHGEVSTLLKALDFQALDDRGKVDRIARQVANDYEDDGAAESLWRLSRALPVPEMLAIIADRIDIGKLRVRSKDGRWRPTTDVWLPNGLIPSTSIGDEHLLVDDLFHRQDFNLLKNLEVKSVLPEATTVRSGPFYDLWKSAEAARISAESRNSPVPVSEASLRFSPTLATSGLDLLCKASVRTREKVTQRILSDTQYKTKVEFSSAYKSPQVIDGPDMWWVRNFGVLQTRLDLVDVKYCAGAVEGIPVGFLPYPGPAHAEKLELPDSVETVNWGFSLPLAEKKLPCGRVHELYGLLAKYGVRRPTELLVQQADGSTTRYPSEFIVVAQDDDTYQFLLKSAKVPSLYTGNPELTEPLAERWKLKAIKVEFFSVFEHVKDEESETETISALYPFLHPVESKIKRSTRCIPCLSLRTVRSNSYNGEQDMDVHETYRDGSNFYYASTLSSRRLLGALLQDSGSSRRAADVEVEMRRLATVERGPSGGTPVPETEPEHFKTHASGFIPLDASRNLGEQMKLIERAVLRYLDTPDANVFDLRLNFEVDVSHGISNDTVDKVTEHVAKLGGQARFED